MNSRGSGILLHITSLPSPFGIGDLGPWAYRFADFLHEAGQRYWQILPLNPTDLEHGNSPYHSSSAFAGNPLLISPEILAEEGFLDERDLQSLRSFPVPHVDYHAATAFKQEIFERAFVRFSGRERPDEYDRFCRENESWLDDFALFTALKQQRQDKVWGEWPEGIRDRQPGALAPAREELRRETEKTKFLQYLFWKQWLSLKRYCNDRGIRIIGDAPIYMIYDSADLWTHPELFNLDHEKRPLTIAGVPPDYFSETGQLWGNPVYRWDMLRQRRYDWWIRRIQHNLGLFDWVRVDHFRGFVAYWEVPASEKVAVNGKWVEAPAMDFFGHVIETIPELPIIAEDLGTITPDVREVMDHFGFPGMKVLLFAFGDDLATNPYLPHNHVPNSIVYTGTHDNNTVRGWFEREATPEIRERLSRYIGRELHVEGIHWDLIRLAMMSVANTVIFPMQDILGLGQEARMNRPATATGNWLWRLDPDHLTPHLSGRLREMSGTYGRDLSS